MDLFISLATKPTNNTTAIKTSIKEISGNHLAKEPALSFNQPATITDNFNAAASPMMKARREKIPSIKPFLIPLNMASIITSTKAMSIIIEVNGQ